jgi:glycosyltransferase involved in cell wall biosynthesis
MTTQVRLYGQTIGNGSFARVASGMRYGLEANHAFAGMVPIDDSFDEDEIYLGHNSEVAVYVGSPSCIHRMQSTGWHSKTLFLLPPNSTWVPEKVLEFLEKSVSGLISPSTWGKIILERHTSLPVQLWQHGVMPEFKPFEEDRLARVAEYEAGCFDVLHMASTTMQRKGTRELIQAWGSLVSEGKLGRTPMLYLVMEGNAQDLEGVIRKSCTTPAARESIVWSGRLNLPVTRTAEVYRRHHLVCQPSRGEGWGLIPLEARACGVPVTMTTITGHADQTKGMSTGVIPVATGSYDTIDDGPGATAPSLHYEDVAAALKLAYDGWPIISKACAEESKSIHQEWSWAETTNRWLDSYWEM